ncbi:HET-domain-containing protein, partial [Periconia macrospinosa]
EWINVCAHLHGDHCVGNTNNKVENLRLINCDTGEIKRAEEGEEYVALSYVWGQEGTKSKQGSLTYPQTVQDAILATRQLGYSRLWIDQYCLDQNNLPEFQAQLQQMDSIYKQAAVTLVAAAGVNANHGLPGVSTRLRPPTPSVTIDSQTLSPLSSTPNLTSKTSKWMSRAWTFQEGLLSTRRLIFTPTQLYFECRGMYSTE